MKSKVEKERVITFWDRFFYRFSNAMHIFFKEIIIAKKPFQNLFKVSPPPPHSAIKIFFKNKVTKMITFRGNSL